MVRKKFDPKRNCLCYLANESSADFWDEQWEEMVASKVIRYVPGVLRFDPIFRSAIRHLSPGGTVLEGGCGLGAYSYALRNAGYVPVALDYAERTINYLQENLPEVNPLLGDVQSLPFGPHSLDGYLSIGVIEHFWDGYESIAKEAARVLKPGGFLFLSFPTMNTIRYQKASQGRYPEIRIKKAPRGFYQFALDPERVRGIFTSCGFAFVEQRKVGGLKGLKEEIPTLQPLADQLVYRQGLVVKVLRRAADELFAPFFGHSMLLTLRKE